MVTCSYFLLECIKNIMGCFVYYERSTQMVHLLSSARLTDGNHTHFLEEVLHWSLTAIPPILAFFIPVQGVTDMSFKTPSKINLSCTMMSETVLLFLGIHWVVYTLKGLWWNYQHMLETCWNPFFLYFSTVISRSLPPSLLEYSHVQRKRSEARIVHNLKV